MMEFLSKISLLSTSIENQFVLELFNLLLCGVIVLVVLRGWRTRAGRLETKNYVYLFLAFFSLGSSFAIHAASAGALFFFRARLHEDFIDLLSHSFQAGAWVLLAVDSYFRQSRFPSGRVRRDVSARSFLLFLAPLSWMLQLAPSNGRWTTNLIDLGDVTLLAVLLVLFIRRPLGRRRLGTTALAFMLVAAIAHASGALHLFGIPSIVLWNAEQASQSLALFLFAFSLGEISQNLFDRVFVRLQIVFILLASMMSLVIVQSETSEYVAGIRSRSDHLAEFVRAHVDYFGNRNEPLDAIIADQDFLQKITLGFGNLAELKLVRIVADRQVATFEIAENGEIRRGVEPLPPDGKPALLDSLEYSPIISQPLVRAKPGAVEFYVTREFLDQHIRKRIVLIFSLFTAMVTLSTLMIGLVVHNASTTIRKQAQEIETTQQQLMQASKLAAIGELAAGVAHEINNPATTILSMASFWLSHRGPTTEEEDLEDVQEVVNQAQRIAQITSALLTFSRRQALDIRPAQINRIVELSLRSMAAELTNGGISVETQLQPGLPSVLADEGSVTRAFENLIRNAIDAMPEGGTLHIRSTFESNDHPEVKIEISDTGAGIPAESLPRIFDPFFTTKQVGKGTGLGLSIVHGIIKEHRGTITAESQLGSGTTFVITLPTED